MWVMDIDQFCAFAEKLGEAARLASLAHFRMAPAVENKLATGFDPVTRADRDTELALRAIIETRFPDHGIRGEEFPDKPADSPFCWILDPVDGTRAYISGLPVWGVLAGLLEDGRPQYGMMDQPFTGERFLGGPGAAKWVRGWQQRDLSVSGCTKLADATLCTTDPYLFVDQERDGFRSLRHTTKLQRYGLDCYAYCMLAAGQIDLVVESGLQDFDIAPLIPIIEGAGGIVCNWRGEDASAGGQVLAAATPQLRDAALKLLQMAAV